MVSVRSPVECVGGRLSGYGVRLRDALTVRLWESHARRLACTTFARTLGDELRTRQKIQQPGPNRDRSDHKPFVESDRRRCIAGAVASANLLGTTRFGRGHVLTTEARPTFATVSNSVR